MFLEFALLLWALDAASRNEKRKQWLNLKHLWMGHRAFRAANRRETAQIGRSWQTGHAKEADSGKCRMACTSVLNGAEGFRFFYTRQCVGFRSSVEDMPRCCHPSRVSWRCANAMRQGFGDSQTGASHYAETTVRKLHDESSALPCQHDNVNSSPEAFVTKIVRTDGMVRDGTTVDVSMTDHGSVTANDTKCSRLQDCCKKRTKCSHSI